MPRAKHPSNALTPQRIREVKAPGMYADGNGLYLVVEKTGNKHWIQRLVIQGVRRKLGLGGTSSVILKQARDMARENKAAARQGRDPLAEKRQVVMPTFAESAATVIALRRPSWDNPKHAAQWASTLQTYAFPVIGDVPVGLVTKGQVLEVLTPIWHSKSETARRVRQRVSAVMDWAILQDYREDNPAGDALNAVLPKIQKTKRNQAAAPYHAVAGILSQVQESGAMAATKLSLEFLTLTACRSSEVRLAKWGEIDWPSKTWTIPASRMKGRQDRRRDHRVPLSRAALKVLLKARALDDGSGLIFPSARHGQAVSDGTHRALLQDLGAKSPDGRHATAHGFRSSFKDWASEQTDTPDEVSELALAHVRKNATEAAYARSDLFDRRRVLMQQWADYLEGAEAVPEASSA